MIDFDTTVTRKPDFGNFFCDCVGCDYTLRFDFFDEMKICPRCGKQNCLSPAYQAFLKKEREDNRRKIRAYFEQIQKEGV